MSDAREAFTATLLQNGEVLVAGGYGYLGDCLAVAELYNPSTGEWTPTGGMTQGRCSPSATLLPSGNVLVAGGGQTGSFSNTLTSAELVCFAEEGGTLEGDRNRPVLRRILLGGLELLCGQSHLGFCVFQPRFRRETA